MLVEIRLGKLVVPEEAAQPGQRVLPSDLAGRSTHPLDTHHQPAAERGGELPERVDLEPRPAVLVAGEGRRRGVRSPGRLREGEPRLPASRLELSGEASGLHGIIISDKHPMRKLRTPIGVQSLPAVCALFSAIVAAIVSAMASAMASAVVGAMLTAIALLRTLAP